MFISYDTINCSTNIINHLNCTTMFQITKKVVNPANNVISESVFANVDCSIIELVNKIVPKLHNIAKAENTNYSIHGKSFRTRFTIKKLSVYNIEELTEVIEDCIKQRVEIINAHIIKLNTATRVSNKKNNRNENYNHISSVKAIDFLITFEQNRSITNENGEIIID